MGDGEDGGWVTERMGDGRRVSLHAHLEVGARP